MDERDIITITIDIGNWPEPEPFAVHYLVDGVVFRFQVPDFTHASAFEFFVGAGHSKPLAAAFREAGYPAEAGNGTAVFHRVNASGAELPDWAERLVVQPRKIG